MVDGAAVRQIGDIGPASLLIYPIILIFLSSTAERARGPIAAVLVPITGLSGGGGDVKQVIRCPMSNLCDA